MDWIMNHAEKEDVVCARIVIGRSSEIECVMHTTSPGAKPTPVKKASAAAVTIATETTTTVKQTPIWRPLSRRDSQKKREQLLKGNEGSRARRRWENDRLIGVPNAQPPLPSDWEVHPTYPVQVVPYQVAQYWDTGLRQRIEEKTAKLQAQRKKQQRKDGSATGLSVGEVPRDLRDTAKRTPAVRGWVRVLEEPVRSFLKERSEASDAEGDSEDEEIVFVGRKGMASAGKGWKKARREVGSEKVDDGMVFDSLGDDESASFKYDFPPFLSHWFEALGGILLTLFNHRRWLTHSISDYYGLQSHSVTTGEPARRVVYVTVREQGKRSSPKKHTVLPRPLWEMC
ncbi:hypothetical protein CSAL01_07665 [Colletotrichum salicis]|uniref:R3H-associated N-terminal domain-containing protein n=1 Tax=Colletotrichum salicis TaxID=1209931 RepID=A0A135U5P2_9PEZI|nr:hypothetical protein CSAL01_07665 [Colletotrichum salicis]